MQTEGVAATNVVPLMRYRDCAAAIEWLVRVFGFERHFVVGSEGGDVAYAQLTCGSGMIMIGPVGQSDLDDHFKQPDEIGGSATQSCYLTVDDIEAHYGRAKAANAEIVMELKSASFGSQGYSCRDPEGHIWNFGSYDPWRGRRQPGQPDQKARSAGPVARRAGIGRELTVLGLCLSALVATVSSVHTGLISLPSSLVASSDDEQKVQDADRARQSVVELETQRAAVQASLDEARLDLERERAARIRAEQGASAAVERIAKDVGRELDSEKAARAEIEQRLAASDGEAAKLKEAKIDAERAIAELNQQLDAERKLKVDAEAAARTLRERLSLSSSPVPNSPATARLTTGSTASGADAAAAKPGPTPSISAQSAKAADKKEAKAQPIAPAVNDTKDSSGAKVKAWEKVVKPEPVKSQKVKKPRSRPASSASKKTYKPTAKPRPAKSDPPYRGPIL